jgi:two-component system response regulator HydG
MRESTPADPRGRILVVDDDRVFGLWATKVLQARGFEVEHVLDPVAGLTQVESRTWDLVITDVEMPRMTGLEFLQRARHLIPGLPAAVVTAHPTVDRAVTAMRLPGTEFIQKPVTPDAFAAKVEEMIAGRRPAPPPRTENVLAVGAHPGDAEVAAAGALLAQGAAGAAITMLTLSGPALSGQPGAAAGPDGWTRLHAAEFADGGSEPDPVPAAIGRVIARIWPTAIYTHSVHDSRPDHRKAHLAVMAAARRVEAVYCFQSPSATIDFQAARVVGIDEHLDAKIRMVEAFAAQPEVAACLEADLITATSRYWARYCDAQHAEAFEVIRDRSAETLARVMPAGRPT